MCCPFSLRIRLANCFFLLVLILIIFPFKNCHHHGVSVCARVQVYYARMQVYEGQRTTSQNQFLPPALCQSLFSLRTWHASGQLQGFCLPGFCLTTCVLGFQAHQGSIRLFLCITGVELRLPGLLGRRFYSLSHLASPLFPFGSETSTLKISFRCSLNIVTILEYFQL